MQKKASASGVLLIALSGFSFGIMPIFTKLAYACGISLYTLLFLRFFIGAAFMLLLMTLRHLPMPSRKELLAYLLLGAVGYVGQSFAFFSALKYTTAGTVELLLYTYPALVTLGSVLFFRERPTVIKLLSLVLATVGAAVIVGGEFQTEPVGMLLGIACAVIYTGYILISSKVVKEGMGVQSSAFIMLGAAAVYGVFNLFFGFTFPSEPVGFLYAAVIALVSTACAMWSFFSGMAKVGPSTASLISTLEPVVTVVASALVLSERLTASAGIGGALIIAALIVTVLPEKRSGPSRDQV